MIGVGTVAVAAAAWFLKGPLMQVVNPIASLIHRGAAKAIPSSVLDKIAENPMATNLLLQKAGIHSDNFSIPLRSGQELKVSVANGEYAALIRQMPPAILQAHLVERFSSTLDGNSPLANAAIKAASRRLLALDYGGVASAIRETSPDAWKLLQDNGLAPANKVGKVTSAERVHGQDLRAQK